MSSAERVAGSAARSTAETLHGSAHGLEGPLKGYHHETYVLPWPQGHGEGAGEHGPGEHGPGEHGPGERGPGASGAGGRWKCREPRAGLLWFDRRCFFSEEELLCALARLPVDLPVPEVREVGGCRLQRFIEGRTLGSLHRAGHRVPERYVEQLLQVFGQLATVRPGQVDVARRCDPADRAVGGDTTHFLDRLVRFVDDRVYRAHHATYGSLFAALGIPDDAFTRFGERLGPLAPRPFCLLHGDLHRENFIVDGDRRLWVIDWELAMLGDPLYDLATHLYLTRYPADQERRVVERWCAAAERVLPGASRGYEEDLPWLLAFKRVQSVGTDVIRTAMSLSERSARPGPWALWRAAAKLRRVLVAAREPLQLAVVPGVLDTATALRSWLRQHSSDPAPEQ
ncbi:phosphotransferase [Streptomyces boluensis]|uniref:Phosphotransferase n=1 Tax=Streptomyces boluensis TaxID=1775135 RepID=A0A964XLE7_9ACTN|nr:phosphotransferase [Streptomyces boluensis]NBE51503.1 phosphotransferase [Streptomyces boluensis]